MLNSSLEKNLKLGFSEFFLKMVDFLTKWLSWDNFMLILKKNTIDNKVIVCFQQNFQKVQ